MKLLLSLAVILGILHGSQALDPNFYHNLAWALPSVIVLVFSIIVIILSIWFIHKARKGEFLCCKPPSRMRPVYYDPEAKAGISQTKARDEKAPPSYTDALNDQLVQEDESTTDDRAPLNP